MARRGVKATARGGVLALLVAGCAARPAIGVRREVTPADGSGPRAQALRLGWVAWADDRTFVTCDRRLDDLAQEVGMRGPCSKVTPGQGRTKVLAWDNQARPDRRAVEVAPSGCAFELVDGVVAPSDGGAPEARLYLAPDRGGEKRLVERWAPPPEVEGERFRVEASLSPEASWLGLAYLAVGLGDGERLVRVVDSRVVPAPACPTP